MTSIDLRTAIGGPAAEAVLEQLFAQDTVGLGLMDADLRYVRVNGALAAMNGVPAAAHAGRTPREVIGEIADVVEPMLAAVLAGTPVHDLEIAAPDGRAFRASYLPVGTGPGPATGLVALVAETTAGRRTEEALRLSRERLAMALEGTRTGTFEWEVATGALRWSENLGEIWGRERGWTPPDYEAYLETLHPDDRQGVEDSVRVALEGGRGYVREHRILWPSGEVRWVQSRVHVVCGDDGRPAALVGLTADITDRRHRELAADFLSQASLVLAESLDIRDTLQHIAELAVPRLGDWTFLHLGRDDGGLDLVAVASAAAPGQGLVERLRRRHPPRPEAPAGPAAVLASRRPERYEQVTDEALQGIAIDADHLASLRALGLRSLMIVPLVARGRTLGTVAFAYTQTPRRYAEEDLELALELGRRAGVAIDNAQLLDGERRAHRQMQELLAVTDVALSDLPLSDMLTELLTRVRDLVGDDLAASFIEVTEQGAPRVRASVGQGDRVVLEIPLRAGGEHVGLLRLAAAGDRDFDEDEIRLLDRAADRAALAIAHAQTYDQARSTSDLLQRSLLPSQLPRIPGLEIAVRYVAGQKGSEVGGDWYDVLALPGGCCALTVGDVMGRGVAAAAGMGSLRAALRAYVHARQAPATSVEALDDLVAHLGEVEFATLACVVMDPASGRGSVCLAGHPPPVLRSRAGDARVLDVRPGVPIGAPPGPRGDHAFEQAPGDLLLLYTDGLVERRDADVRDRIAELARVVADGPLDPEALLDHVVARMVGDDHGDDLALLAVRRTADS